jgi:phosphoribosylglycinamide formyltransferase-1
MNRLGILLSGRGSNFVAIADAIKAGRLDADIAVVLSNNETAHGLKLARELGIPTFAVPAPNRDQAFIEHLHAHKVDLICLAGYMRILSPLFIATFRDRILNIHPSLLPSFPGLNSQRQALAHGVKVTGCTVHFVDEGLDSGPIVRQAPVAVIDGDTHETLSTRILKEEHRIYSEAIGLVLSGHYRISRRRVVEA